MLKPVNGILGIYRGYTATFSGTMGPQYTRVCAAKASSSKCYLLPWMLKNIFWVGANSSPYFFPALWQEGTGWKKTQEELRTFSTASYKTGNQNSFKKIWLSQVWFQPGNVARAAHSHSSWSKSICCSLLQSSPCSALNLLGQANSRIVDIPGWDAPQTVELSWCQPHRGIHFSKYSQASIQIHIFLKACDFKPEYWRLGLLCFTCSLPPTSPHEEEMAFPEKLNCPVDSTSGGLFCGFGFIFFKRRQQIL